MRLAILIAAFGVVSAMPAVAPIFSPAAEAQAATGALTAEERTLQAQIVALAQAGDTDGLKALIRRQVAAGKAGVLAKVAKAVSGMAATIAGTDSSSAAALASAAVTIASDNAVSAADNTVASEVGSDAATVVTTVQTTDPQAAATVQVAVSNSGNAGVQSGFISGGNTQTADSSPVGGPGGDTGGGTGGGTGTTQQTGSTTTTTTTRTTNTPVVVTPTTTTTPEVPVVPEPNPGQAGSPT